MAFRPNYRFERSERQRLKQAKKDEKLRRQQERKAQRDDSDTPAPEDGAADGATPGSAEPERA